MLSDAEAVIATVAGAVNVALFAGEVSDTVGAGLLAGSTVIDTGEDVVDAPWLSVARAVSAYVPAATFVHEMLNGAEVSVPMDVPLAKNWTWATVPSTSLADALTAIVAGAVKRLPPLGLLIEELGGRLTGWR